MPVAALSARNALNVPPRSGFRPLFDLFPILGLPGGRSSNQESGRGALNIFKIFKRSGILAELSQLRAIFGNFAIIFGVKSCASIAEL
jgi:hypothetical protein